MLSTGTPSLHLATRQPLLSECSQIPCSEGALLRTEKAPHPAQAGLFRLDAGALAPAGRASFKPRWGLLDCCWEAPRGDRAGPPRATPAGFPISYAAASAAARPRHQPCARQARSSGAPSRPTEILCRAVRQVARPAGSRQPNAYTHSLGPLAITIVVL